MYCTPLELTLVSAHDIKYVNLFSKMNVYAVVSITGGAKKQKLKTPAHKGGGTNPKWNHSLKFTLDDAALNQDHLKVEIQLVSDRTLRDTKIGKVVIPAKELLQYSGTGVSYQLVTRKGRSKGSVSFRYKLGEKYWVEPEPKPEPVMAYPAAGYGNPPVVQPPKKSKKGKLTLGLFALIIMSRNSLTLSSFLTLISLLS